MVVVAEVAIGVTVLGFFLSPHITKLMEVSREWADSEVTKHKLSQGNKDLLRKLAQDLEDIRSSLHPTSTAFVNDEVRLNQLWRLKDDIHDAEEVLDLFELEIRATAVSKKKKKKKKTKKKKRHGNKGWLSSQLETVLNGLEKTGERTRELHGQVQSSILTRAETGQNPVRDKGSFFGYQDKYAQLVNMLSQSQHPDVTKVKVDGKMQRVIAIVGHAGMGKTELARRAFQDAKGKFDRRIWVHAYGKNTESDLLKEMWKSVAGHKPVGEMNVACLQRELEKLLASRRCLLVLDDVWNHESATSEVKRKQASLALDSFKRFAEDGSRIVMTTRARICSDTFKADASIILDGIEPKEVKDLINHTATDGTSGGTFTGIQKLLNEQVPRLKGSPLAAVEIGDALRKQTTSDKRCNILHNIEHHLGSVLQGHLFTYRHLPPHLQRCFQFCSIFPYNWSFEPDKLTKMWMALGFVEEAQQGPSMEDVAIGYFHSLVDRSLFKEGGEPRGKETTYVIHEQIHWMVRKASARNCISISGDSTTGAAKKSIPATVRHLSVTSGCLDQLKEYSIGPSNLRTLLVLKDGDDDSDPAHLITAIDKDILQQFKGVRVLDLTGTGITELPASIGKLKHVRYLGLPCTISKDLGDQVTRLLFLQTLSVGQGNKWENRDRKRECITNISGIGMLVKLRESIVFEVKKGSEKDGHSVSELAGMNSLRGTLRIIGLDAVGSKEEAEQAQLGNKCSVKVLKLEWRAPGAGQVDGEPAAGSNPAVAVLEGLKPHSHLHDLHITRYPGETSPTWLSEPEKMMQKLTRLYLKNCRKLEALPAVGRLPCLELLDMKELTVVVRIDSGFCGGGDFPMLKKIVLDDMKGLVAWDDMPKTAFPLLNDVSIADCPRLSSLSGLGRCTGPVNLRVKRCPAITQVTLPANFNGGNSTCKFY